MSYLEDFQTQINNRDFSKFLQLWEEYSNSDNVDVAEFRELLQAIKSSDFAKLFGQFVETALPLWKMIQNEKDSYEILKYLIDLQNTNSPLLADLALEAIKKNYGETPELLERLRLIGLRNRENFQGALSNYDLLAHTAVGKFVFHTGGWGTGEIMELSSVREQIVLEFENVAGRKHITFSNAFKTLYPLPDDSFLARRFANPDLLEKEAKEDPVAILKLLLRDLGPRSAAEIKDDLCGLVIPENEWAKWWQAARAKIKKDPIIETPESTKGVFRLRKTERSTEEHLQHTVHSKNSPEEIIQASYNFLRDQPAALRKEEVKGALKDKLLQLLKDPALSKSQELQAQILLDIYFSHPESAKNLKNAIKELADLETIINAIEIVAIKKRALALIKELRPDWIALYISFLKTVSQSTLRDFILKELNQGETKKILIKELDQLRHHPIKNPELFIWFFQKVVAPECDPEIPFSTKEGQCQFFESFFILLSGIESKQEYKDLAKKMYTLLSAKRYALVRRIIEGTSLEFIKEFLLLVTKCQSLSDHDIKILHSLAAVVHPSLAAPKSRKSNDTNILWTTEKGYLKAQERAKQLGTTEIVENAREIEAARALGDLRENSEYKFALERRSRLQSELKTISDQLNRARIITRENISPQEVSIGSVVDLNDQKNHKITYTILGPWDADADEHILSAQSKFAEAMLGLKLGEMFTFRNEQYTVVGLKSFFDE